MSQKIRESPRPFLNVILQLEADRLATEHPQLVRYVLVGCGSRASAPELRVSCGFPSPGVNEAGADFEFRGQFSDRPSVVQNSCAPQLDVKCQVSGD